MRQRPIYMLKKNGDKERWVRIGVAHEHKDGSLECFLDAMPLDGKFVIDEQIDIKAVKMADGTMKQFKDG